MLPGQSPSRPRSPLTSARRPRLPWAARTARARDAVSQVGPVHVAGVDCQDLAHLAFGFVEVTGIDCSLRACEVSDQFAKDGRG
jgi:hypothetical protein